MELDTTSLPLSTVSPNPPPPNSLDTAIQVSFCVIAVASFTFNLLFCIVLLRKPSMLRKPHNILLFSLAVVDMLTGVFLVATPGYAIPKSAYPVPPGLGGEIFCRLLANRYLLFAMGKVSILLVACLAIERWYCVLRPIIYKNQFSRKRIIIYVFIMFIITCLLSMNKFFESSLAGKKCISKKAPYGTYGTRAFIIAYSFVAFYIPCLLTWLTFAHISMNLPSSPGESTENVNKRRRQRLLLRMCALTAAALTVCVFPSQTIYILSPFGITKIGSPLHKGFNVLVFINSCMNPLIYCFTNKEYRREFKKLLGCRRGNEISPETELGSTQTQATAAKT
ncbi:galanin receptor 2a-like [Oculina patagonica]